MERSGGVTSIVLFDPYSKTHSQVTVGLLYCLKQTRVRQRALHPASQHLS